MTPAQAVAAGADWIVVGRPITERPRPAAGGSGHRRQSPMTQVKICGINDAAAFDTAVEAGADWVGFVFFPPSPRYVTPMAAMALSARRVAGPPRVGLFVDPTVAMIAQVLDTVQLDVTADLRGDRRSGNDKAALRPADLACSRCR